MHRAFVVYFCALFALSCTRNFEAASSTSARLAITKSNIVCPKIKGTAQLHESQKVLVTKITDGDTFTACLMPDLGGSVRVRVLGIDCPESRKNAKCKRDGLKGRPSCAQQIPLGKEASALARSLLENKIVFLESPNGNGRFEQDNFGRWLAYARTEAGEDYGRIMIDKGHCENYHWKYPHPRGLMYQHIYTKQ